jgi:ATP-dependent DNA helicase RecQ
MPVAESSLLQALQTHWGYNSFRPLQREAIDAVLEHRDSVVVLPTGGGKSLCYQVPAVLMDGLAVIVSPLISLMKDQVDGLRECGVPAAAVHSALGPRERQEIADDIRADRLKLLYVAPERLCTERMLDFLQQRKVSFIAIDEAHCISNWGHDFRPEYRMLGELRQRFPGIGLHGYTATATEDVRRDIAEQLQLRKTEFLVGNFDRPNLQYRVIRREKSGQQIHEVLQRHNGESGIIYCISRKEVDALTQTLKAAGVKAAGYHAGLSDEERHRNQDAFLNEQVYVVVATVAFGMGIDKPNVRFVLHTGAPKSLEHYQQETGRAGRDSLDSECVLLYGGNDFMVWRKLNDQLTGDPREQMERNLRVMESFCTGVTCRHRALVEHFGQTYEAENCGACDVCLNQQEVLPDALVVAQKILSCVVRVNENFGGDYVAQVLVGSTEQRILENGHDRLSTYGLLKEQRKTTVREWIEQLCGQDYIAREGEYRVLKVTATGREVLRGQRTPRLLAAEKRGSGKKSEVAAKGRKNFSEGMDPGLFEALRLLRRHLAEEAGVPPYVVFGDVTLQDLSRRRPTTLDNFRLVHGVGEHKAKQYAEPFLAEISRYCTEHGVSTDISTFNKSAEQQAIEAFRDSDKSSSKIAAAALFREGKSIAEVAQQVGRASATVMEYLAKFLEEEGYLSPEPWVDGGTFASVLAVAQEIGDEKLKPIFERLGGNVSYDQIRISLACFRNHQPAD